VVAGVTCRIGEPLINRLSAAAERPVPERLVLLALQTADALIALASVVTCNRR
jgi:hypothetical protein